MRSTRFITRLEAAQSAAHVYENKSEVRTATNTIQIPDDWQTITDEARLFHAVNDSNGFMARAYFRLESFSQIVISYAGTTDEPSSVSLDWLYGNTAGAGLLANQVQEAAAFYTRLRIAYPSEAGRER
jgi:hypothetical protein